jgi:hypothetical protein
VNTNAPIGTIIASILGPIAFAKAAADDPSFDVTKAKWCPADGRSIAGSELDLIYVWPQPQPQTGAPAQGTPHHAPDLRGVFLRGLNLFLHDGEGEEGRYGQKIKDNSEEYWEHFGDAGDAGRARGAGYDFQLDQFERHTHKYVGQNLRCKADPNDVHANQANAYTFQSSQVDFNQQVVKDDPTPIDGPYHVGFTGGNVEPSPGDPHDASGPNSDTIGETRPRNVAVYFYIRINS